MADFTIQIDPAELRRASSAVKKDVSSLQTSMDEARTAVTNTSGGSWGGQAGETTRTKMQQLTSTHVMLTERLERWAVFLENAAQQYESTETSINSMAEDVGSTPITSLQPEGPVS